MAGGFSINISNIDILKNFIINKFKNINKQLIIKKTLFLDDRIAPSAI